ncbi:TPA: glycosyltransferase family 1 protein, partial [Enterobacter asburiae]|nr:glycosyltransferase family 1 protein [Enterobacter asburiae]
MRKIHIIGTVGVPACYGGFETLVDNLLDDTR